MRTAALLLLAGVMRHQVWEHVVPDQQARMWNMLGAGAMLVLLLLVATAERDALVRLVAAWWAYEELLVAGCAAWHLLDPWVIGPGQEACSARLGFKLGAFSLVAIGWIAATLLDQLRRGRTR